MPGKNVLIIVGDMVEDLEIWVPYQMLLLASHNPFVVAPDRKKGDEIRTACHFFDGGMTYSERLGHGFKLNYTFSDVTPSRFDALLLPGGRAPEYLRKDQRVLDIVNHFIDEKKPIGGLCHGVQILCATERMKGVTMTGYEMLSKDMEKYGANYKQVAEEDSITEGNIVTAPIYHAHPAFMFQFMQLLGTKIST